MLKPQPTPTPPLVTVTPLTRPVTRYLSEQKRKKNGIYGLFANDRVGDFRGKWMSCECKTSSSFRFPSQNILYCDTDTTITQIHTRVSVLCAILYKLPVKTSIYFP